MSNRTEILDDYQQKLRAAVRCLTNREISAESIQKMGDVARIMHWTPNEPMTEFFTLVDAQCEWFSESMKQFPTEIKACIEKIQAASETEIASCKEKIALTSAEMRSDLVREVVPQVADAAREQISKMSTKIEMGQRMLSLFLGISTLAFVFGISFFATKLIPLLDFLKHVNTGIYSISTIIEVAVSHIAVAMFFVSAIFGCLCLSGYSIVLAKKESTMFYIGGFAVVTIFICVFFAMSFLVSPTNIQIVTEKSAAPVLFSAIRSNAKPELIDEIIATGVNINVNFENENGLTPLMLAAVTNPNPEVIKKLVDFGAHLNAKDKWGNTPLLLAVEKNPNPEVAVELIKLGADINAKRDEANNMTTPIVLAILREDAGSEVITAALIKAGVDLNKKIDEKDNFTILMFAAGRAKIPDIISVLVKNGANISEKNKDGFTAFDFAQGNDILKKSSVIQLLKPPTKK